MQNAYQLQTLGQILMFLILMRLVAAISVHPRVSLITGTLINSGDDLAHFVFSFTIIFVVLSAIGTWAFGADYPEYRTLGTTFMTQWVNMIGGAVPEGMRVRMCVPSLLAYALVLNVGNRKSGE